MPLVKNLIRTYLCQIETVVHLCCDMVKTWLQLKMSSAVLSDYERQGKDIVNLCT